MAYPEYIMRYLRQRCWLERDDTSQDDRFTALPPRVVFREAMAWNGLLGNWDRKIITLVKDIYGVDLDGGEAK